MFFKILLLLVSISIYSFPLSKISTHHVETIYEAIGVKTIKYTDEARSRPVFVEIWYPTDRFGPFDNNKEGIWIHPRETRDAPFLNQKFPLIVMSHGHSGDRRDRSWLAEKLVMKGYIVASVDHFGNTRDSLNLLVSLRFWERPLDISFALSQLINDPEISSHVDVKKIGFVGYSLGGMTGLSLAGARASNLKQLALQQKKNIKELDTATIEKIDFSEGERDFSEPRIKSFLLLCPATFAFSLEGLKKIKAPIGLVAAINDEVLPHKDHAYRLIKSAIAKRLKVMRNEISHYSFLNLVSEKGKKLLHKDYTRDPSCCDRKSIHNEVAQFALEFFKESLQ